MNKLGWLIVMFFACGVCDAQNLVPNGDFEQYSGCPVVLGDFDSLLYWFNPCLPPYGGGINQSGSPDYINVCNNSGIVDVPSNYYGFQYAYSGSGYAALIPYSSVMDFREYIEVPLVSPLVSNTNYYFQMYVSVADRSAMTTDTISVYFSDVAIANLHSHEPLPYTPQLKIAGFITDTLNWVPVSGNYTATGGENYLLIGNFNNDMNSNMISLSGNYGACIFYIEDVSLTVNTAIEEENQNDEIKIFPNPFSKNINIILNGNEHVEVSLFDVTSRKIFNQSFTIPIAIGTISINTEQLAKGIYLYEVRNKNGVVKKGKVVKE